MNVISPLVPSLLGRCQQKQRGLRGLLCRWPSITECEMYITAHGPRLRNDLYCVEWDVKLYCTIPLCAPCWVWLNTHRTQLDPTWPNVTPTGPVWYQVLMQCIYGITTTNNGSFSKIRVYYYQKILEVLLYETSMYNRCVNSAAENVNLHEHC